MNDSVIINDRLPALFKSMAALVNSEVLVGVPASTTERDAGEPINNAALAYIHENGAPDVNIPARPFLVPGVRAAEGKTAAQLKKAAAAALNGDDSEVDKRLTAAGLVAESSVKNTLNSGMGPALADSTIAARQRRGRTGTVPLIDTGELRNSITHVVKRK